MAESKIPFNKPHATWEQIVKGTNAGTVGVLVPVGATGGKIVRLSCLGQALQYVDYTLTLSNAADKHIAYFAASGQTSPVSGYANLYELIKAHASFAYVEWEY